MNLRIEPIEDRSGSEGLALQGVLDLESRDSVVTQVGAALHDCAGPDFTLVLSFLTFVDSSGLSALVTLSNQARSMGKTVIMRDPTPALSSLLSLTALDQVFVIERAGQRNAPNIVPADPS
ncbi:MAG: STAS domain-containing protein [Jatrophihabitantaceae bacterium]